MNRLLLRTHTHSGGRSCRRPNSILLVKSTNFLSLSAPREKEASIFHDYVPRSAPSPHRPDLEAEMQHHQREPEENREGNCIPNLDPVIVMSLQKHFGSPPKILCEDATWASRFPRMKLRSVQRRFTTPNQACCGREAGGVTCQKTHLNTASPRPHGKPITRFSAKRQY